MTNILDDLVYIARKHATEVLIERKEPSLHPLIHIVAKGEHFFYPLSFADEQDKQRSLAMVKVALKRLNADAYVTVSEAWTVIRQAEGDDRERTPSKADDRLEVVVCCAATKDDRRMAIWEMERDSSGAVVALTDLSSESGMGVGGRMAELFES